MTNCALSRATYDKFLEHVANITEKREIIISECASVISPEEYEDLRHLLTDYLQRLEGLAKTLRKTVDNELPAEERRFPVALIGSRVTVQDLENKEKLAYTLIHPGEINDNIEAISYLSPMGRSLLLRKIGDDVEVAAPGGTFKYRITDISLM